MSKKLYDVTVKTSEYQNNQGETKGRYENIGVMMQGDNGPYLILKRTFNPAGVRNPDDRDTVICSLFEDRSENQQQGGYGGGQQAQRAPAQQAPMPADDFDDDIPF